MYLLLFSCRQIAGEIYGAPLDGERPGSSGIRAEPKRESELLETVAASGSGPRQYRLLVPATVHVRRSPQEQGAELFRALFPEAVRSIYWKARNKARRLRLNLQLDLEDPRTRQLHRLPWELLWDPEESYFLLLDRGTTLIRHSLGPKTAQPAVVGERLRVLPVASNPEGGARLALGLEDEGLRRACGTGSPIEVLDRPERAELLEVRRRLLDEKVQILHFMGHGDIDEDNQGRLHFEGEAGELDPVKGEALASVLGDLGELRLVVLNACRGAEIRAEPYSGVATALIRRGLPAVVAMQSPISDDGAIAFSYELYRRLAQGEDLDLALCEARHAIHLENPESSPEWATPVLFAASIEPLILPRKRESRPEPEGPNERELKKRYLAYLVEELDGVEVSWLPPSSPLWRLRLTKVYSKLRPARRSSRDLTAAESEDDFQGLDTEADGEPAEVQSWAEVLAEERRLALVGSYGSGKSHLLRHTAWSWAVALVTSEDRRLSPRGARTGRPRKAGSGGPLVPVLIQAASFAAARRNHPGLRFSEYIGRHLGPDLETPIADVAGRRLDPANLQRLLLRELVSGEASLLVDGIEAIADAAERWAVAEEIQTFLRFLASSSAGSRKATGCRVVLACQPGSELLQGIDESIHRFELQPLDGEELSEFCAELAQSTGSVLLHAQLEVLEKVESQRRGFWPAEVVLFSHFLSSFGGSLPERLADLAQVLDEFLHQDWEAGQQESTDLDTCREWRRLLPELAATALDEVPWQQVDARWALRWLRQRFSGMPLLALEETFVWKLGPLVSVRNDSRLLHRLLHDLLGALWLVSDRTKVQERLRERRDSPRWRRPAAIGLGLLSKVLTAEELMELTREVAGEKNSAQFTSTTRALPVRLFFLAEILGELEEPPGTVVELIVRRLLHGASSPIPPLRKACHGMLLARVGEPRGSFVLRTAVKALEADSSLAPAVARLVAAAPLSPRTAEFLELSRARDRSPWPLETALRRIASEDPALLSAPRYSLRRAVRREPALVDRIEADTAWRRLVLNLYGGNPHNPTLFPPDPWLEEQLVRAIETGQPPEKIVEGLRETKGNFSGGSGSHHAHRGLAARVLLAGGGTKRQLRMEQRAALSSALDRSLVALPAKVRSDKEILTGLRRVAGSLSPGVCVAVLHAALPHVAGEDRADLLLNLALHLPVDRRPPVLGNLLWELSANVLGKDTRGEAGHRLAVLLDTRGALLSEPAWVLAETCLAWAEPTLPAPLAGGGSSLTPERLGAVLDSVVLLPSFLAPFQALALTRLAPRLIVAGLALEVEILAELALPERHGLRAMVRDAVGAPTGGASESQLVERAFALNEPWRRFRALRRLAYYRCSLRQALAFSRFSGSLNLAPLEIAAYSISSPHLRALAFEALATGAPAGCRTAWALESAATRYAVADGEQRVRLGLRLLALRLHPEPMTILRQLVQEILALHDEEAKARALWMLRHLNPGFLDSEPQARRMEWSSEDLRSLAQNRFGEMLLRHLGPGGTGSDLLAARVLATDFEVPSREAPPSRFVLNGASLAHLDAALASADQEQRRRAELERMEGGELDLASFEAVFELTDSPDDLLRLRAAMALHGSGAEQLPWRSAGRIGLEVLLAMARRWRTLRWQNPSHAIVIRWAFATLRHDSPELLASLVRETSGEGRRALDAEAVLRLLEALDGKVVPEIVKALHEGSARAQRALVLGLATVVGRGRDLPRIWPKLAADLPMAAVAGGRERISLQGPAALVASAEKAWRRLGSYGTEAVARAQELLDESAQSWADLLRLPPEELLASLARIGRRQFYGEGLLQELRKAEERAVAQPELLPLLLNWIEQRWRRDLQELAPGEHQAADLLQLVAAVARRLPGRYRESLRDRPFWGRLLRDAVLECDRFGGRIAALRLLALRRSLDEGAVLGLLAAVGDVPEVEKAAFAVLDSFSEMEDPEVLAPLEAVLRGPSATEAYLAGRLLVRLASRSGTSPTLVARTDSLLLAAASDLGRNREVYLATVESRSCGRILGIEHRGRLDHLLYGLRLELHRVGDMQQDFARGPSEATE